jgi:hypothetical protein
MDISMIQWLIRIIGILASIVSIMYVPRAVYAVVGFFKTRKFPPLRGVSFIGGGMNRLVKYMIYS